MRYKSAILALLFIITAILPSLASCRTNYTGTETAVAFLEDICASDFESAYSWVKTEISEDEFIRIYENFFNTLSVNSVEYESTASFETEVYSTYKYTLTYSSSEFDPITDDFEITVKLDEEKHHYVDWSPALVLPEMEYGDTLYRTRITAERGDITAESCVLAQNVPFITVSLQTQQTETYTEKEILENINTMCSELNLEKEDIMKKASYTIKLDVISDDENPTKKEEAAFEKQLDENIEFVCDTLNLDEKTLRNQIKEHKKDKAQKSNTLAVGTYFCCDIDDEVLQELSKRSGVHVTSSIYNGFVLIEEYYPIRADNVTLDRLSEHEGIEVRESSFSSTRYYPSGSLLSHTLGYTWSMERETAEAEVARLNEGRTEQDGLYTTGSITGRNGIEKAYETELRGKDGFRIYLRSQDGVNKRTLFEQPAQDGLDVKLTIDIDLQEKAEALLENTLYGTNMAGAVIVMHPRTGAIEAIASYPTYDLNLYASGITADELEAYLKLNAHQYNRAVEARLPPGSVYKPITASAVLENNVMGVDYIFTGEIINDEWKIPEKYGETAATDRIKRHHVKRRNSPLNMRNAMIHSDNIYFANAALMLGDKGMEEYWNNLRLNEPIDFELPVSSSQFKDAKDERNVIKIAETGFGQGTMLVTPLQIATTFCAFANGGDIPTPYIVDGLYKDDGKNYEAVEKTEPTVWKSDAVDSYVCRKINEMLLDVVSPKYNGTAPSLGVKSCTVAGKTGTAQIQQGVREISWFIGYRTDVPDADGRLVLVVLEVPDDDRYSNLKFPIARELLEIEKDTWE